MYVYDAHRSLTANRGPQFVVKILETVRRFCWILHLRLAILSFGWIICYFPSNAPVVQYKALSLH
jgi:hypothetical protein